MTQQSIPELEKCDRYGNLLAWEKNNRKWSIVHHQFFIDYRVCYEQWAYLPPDPLGVPPGRPKSWFES